jgi:predicted transcriptional regulator
MDLLLANKPCKLLQAISRQTGKKGITEIGKDIYATYKSRWEVINGLEASGLIYTEKMGREVVPYLTATGKVVLEYVNYILKI